MPSWWLYLELLFLRPLPSDFHAIINRSIWLFSPENDGKNKEIHNKNIEKYIAKTV